MSGVATAGQVVCGSSNLGVAGNVVLPAAADVRSGVHFGAGGGTAGAYGGSSGSPGSTFIRPGVF
jgi:hypothetical protein